MVHGRSPWQGLRGSRLETASGTPDGRRSGRFEIVHAVQALRIRPGGARRQSVRLGERLELRHAELVGVLGVDRLTGAERETAAVDLDRLRAQALQVDRKSTRLNSSH